MYLFIVGKGSEEELKSMVSTIHNIKEKLKGENDELKRIKHKLKEIQEKQKAEKEVLSQGNVPSFPHTSRVSHNTVLLHHSVVTHVTCTRARKWDAPKKGGYK